MILLYLSFFIIFLALFAIYIIKSIHNPYWLVILIPVGSYLGYMVQIFKEGVIPLSLFQIFLILFFIIFIFNRFLTSDFEIRLLNLEIEFLLFFMLIYMSLIYSPNRSDGFLYATRFVVLIAMVYLLYNTVKNVKQIKLILLIVLGVSIVLAIISIKNSLLNPQAVFWNYFTSGKKLATRASGTYQDPNIFATHFFTPIFFVASMFVRNDRKLIIKFIWLVIFGILFFGIISTFSRSAWVSIIIGLFILVILNKQYKIIWGLAVIGILAFLFIPYFQILLTNIFKRFLDIFAGASDESSKIRILLGIGGLEMFFSSYTFGIGFRGFPIVFPQYISTSQTLGVVEPHGLFYTLLAELGLLGFCLYLFILIKIGFIAYNNFVFFHDTLEKAISGTLLVTFISYIIFYQFYGGGLMDNNFWMIVALIFCINSIRKHNKNKLPERG